MSSPGTPPLQRSHCPAEVQTTGIQTKPQGCTDSPLGPSTAGLQTLCALALPAYAPNVSSQRQAGVPGDKAAALQRAESCNWSLPPPLSHSSAGPLKLSSGWQQPSKEAVTNKWQASKGSSTLCGDGRLQGAGDEMCIRQVGNICSLLAWSHLFSSPVTVSHIFTVQVSQPHT